MYVRESYVELARLIVTFFGEPLSDDEIHALLPEPDVESSTAPVFTNPFAGFESKHRKNVVVSGTPHLPRPLP